MKITSDGFESVKFENVKVCYAVTLEAGVLEQILATLKEHGRNDLAEAMHDGAYGHAASALFSE